MTLSLSMTYAQMLQICCIHFGAANLDHTQHICGLGCVLIVQAGGQQKSDVGFAPNSDHSTHQSKWTLTADTVAKRIFIS